MMILLQDLTDLASSSSGTGSPKRSRLVQIAIISRVLVLIAMAVSCHFLPNDNPGDDVFQFSLRFPQQSSACFCLQGQACDVTDKDLDTVININACADSAKVFQSQRPSSLDAFYKFLLTPLTRWDASRFLDLAVYPTRRDPPHHLKSDYPSCYDENNNDLPISESSDDCKNLFLPTEEAHAFFPMLTILIRTTANLLLQCFPPTVLPPTYEGVTTLAAMLWNLLCFIIASLAFYDLTLQLTQEHLILVTDLPKKSSRDHCEQLAYHTFLLFCFNPASVFFTTAYSESTFAMCNFTGHAILVRILLSLRRQSKITPRLIVLYVASSLVWLSLWMTASYTRSNGSINSCWLILQGIALVCLWGTTTFPFRALMGFLSCFLLAVLVAFPVYWHDIAGYRRHCLLEDDANVFMTPLWCSIDSNQRFSLYGYVQRQHWNVGLFRYYTWKKIPNFLLAAPILMLGIMATTTWIQTSFTRYLSMPKPSTRSSGSIKILWDIVGWAMTSLRASVEWMERRKPSLRNDPKGINEMSRDSFHSQTNLQLLVGPMMLGHYAVLSVVCLVGLLVAHVEITTRMICSSCPAIYWYMAFCCGGSDRQEKTDHDKARLGSREKIEALLGRWVLPYCFLYILLGAAMHPNWLPWT